jgi:DNA helicase HerA-like ATPase
MEIKEKIDFYNNLVELNELKKLLEIRDSFAEIEAFRDGVIFGLKKRGENVQLESVLEQLDQLTNLFDFKEYENYKKERKERENKNDY